MAVFALAFLLVTSSIIKAGGSGANSIASSPDDRFWDASFGAITSENVSINVIAVSGDKAYVGGSFPTFLGLPSRSIAMWDGNRWRSLGYGFFNSSGNTGEVRTIATAPNGDVYIGGDFASASGVPCNNLVRWDGQRFYAITPGITGAVNALYFYDNELYVGGQFELTIGGKTVKNIVKWTGNDWATVGDGIADGTVRTIVANSEYVYVGGNFKQVDGKQANYIAAWKKSAQTWLTLGSGFSQQSASLSASVLTLTFAANGDLIAGGDFTKSGSTSINNLARWNGSAWAPLGGGVNGIVTTLYANANNIYVSGSFDKAGTTDVYALARWDGSQWNAAGGDLLSEGSPAAIGMAGNKLLIGGSFTINSEVPGEQAIKGLALWNGTAWLPAHAEIKGNGADGGVFDLAVTGDGSLYAAGGFGRIGTTAAPIMAKYNGTTWSAVEGTNIANQFNSIRVLPEGNNLLIACNFRKESVIDGAGIARYNPESKEFSLIGTLMPNPQQGGGQQNQPQTNVLLKDGNKLYVGGNYRGIDNDSTIFSLVVKDGSSNWKGFGQGLTNKGKFKPQGGTDSVEFTNPGGVQSLAIDANGDIYAGGFFMFADAARVNSFARWNGAIWEGLGDTLSAVPQQNQGGGGGFNFNLPQVAALAIVGDNIYVGGFFIKGGTTPLRNLAVWNKTTKSWSSIGNADQRVNVFRVVGDYLYVGGGFDSIGGIRSPRIARYHIPTNTWYAMGSGIEGFNVWAMAPAFGGMYCGGVFGAAGEKSSVNIAKWTQDLTSVEDNTSAEQVEAYSSPNPVSTSAQIRFSLPSANFVSLEIYNAAGARVESLANSYMGNGDYTFSWDASAYQSGIYYARLQNGHSIHTHKIVVLH